MQACRQGAGLDSQRGNLESVTGPGAKSGFRPPLWRKLSCGESWAAASLAGSGCVLSPGGAWEGRHMNDFSSSSSPSISPAPVPAHPQEQIQVQKAVQKYRQLPNWRNVNSGSLSRAAVSTSTHFTSRPAAGGSMCATSHSTHWESHHLHRYARAGKSPIPRQIEPSSAPAMDPARYPPPLSVPAMEPPELLPHPELPLPSLFEHLFPC